VAAAATFTRRPRAPVAARSPLLLAIGACVAVAVLSLLIADQPTYDPTAWLVWGREVVHGDLTTTSGPSWKPLPVLVTAPSALLGDTAQRVIWLVVARTGTLVALLLVYRLGRRLQGPVAGAIAVAALLFSSGYLTRTFRGDSEGILVALVLGAVEAHLARRRWLAFGLLVATALVRPEMLLYAGLYALRLLLNAGSPEARVRTAAIAAGAAAVVIAAWLVPERLGSGEWLRAASRALEPVAGSPATADRPFVATFTNAAPVLPWPLYAAGIALVAAALAGRGPRHERGLILGLAALATALMATVALMAEIGFTGNARYLTVPVALTGILGGAGIVWLARLAGERLPAGRLAAGIALLVAVGVAAPSIVHAVTRTDDQVRGGLNESRAYAALPAAIDRVGGPAAVRACRPVRTAWYDVPAVARVLHVHTREVGIRARASGTVLGRRGTRPPRPDPRFPTRTLTKRWAILSSCPR
jgi:hypothetical protein